MTLAAPTVHPWAEAIDRVEVCGAAAWVDGAPIDLKAGGDMARRELGRALYAAFHVRGSAEDRVQADERYCSALERLHVRETVRELGWEPVAELPEDRLKVRRGGEHLVVPRASMCDGRLLAPAVRWRWTQGYAAFLSEAGLPRHPSFRLYVNAGPVELAEMLPGLLRGLEARNARYLVKTANNPRTLLRRADGTIVYVEAGDARWAVEQVSGAAQDGRLRTPCSLLARRLAPGLSLAMEPTGGAGKWSFGTHRARVLADWLLAPDGESLGTALERAGIDPDRPHLERGVADPVGDDG